MLQQLVPCTGSYLGYIPTGFIWLLGKLFFFFSLLDQTVLSILPREE